MEQLFASEEDAIKWVGLNIPWAVKPKKKAKTIFINPFSSRHAHDVVVQSLGKQLFKLQQKQHLIDMMNTPLGQEVGHSDQVEETWECYEINVVQARMYGCSSQCKDVFSASFWK